MASIMSTLKIRNFSDKSWRGVYLTSCDDVDFLAEDIDKLSLSFISPLRSHCFMLALTFCIKKITDDSNSSGRQLRCSVVHLLLLLPTLSNFSVRQRC